MVDGFSSSSALIQFLKELNHDITVDYMLNYEKKHGLTYRDMSNFTRDQYGLIIIPDASMIVEDARMIKNNFSGDILVLDHHLINNEFFNKKTSEQISREEAKKLYSEDKESLEVDCYTDYCLAVNCTDGLYPNPTLCGAGVVQKFIEAYVDTYSTSEDIDERCKEKYLDLVSIALIADNMDLRNLESRYYALEGLKESHYNNEFLNELADKMSEDMPYGRYITSIGWKISPLVNGVIRYGTEEEQNNLFRAILGEHEDIEYQPRRKHKDDPLPPIEIHSLQKTMARVAINVKSRQDTEVRKNFKELQDTIAKNGLDKNSVIFVDGTKILDKGTVTGLVANKLASEYFRPVVLMRSRNSLEYGGSMRNYSQGNIPDLSVFLNEAGVTTMGHSNASGVSFKKSDLQSIIDKCNEMMPIENLSTVWPCDWEIPMSSLKRDYVIQVAENYEVFGSTVPEPMFAITGIEINANEIMSYGDGKFIRFVVNGIPFIKKYCKHDEFENLTLKTRNTLGVNKKRLKINIIGQFILSKFEDKVVPEIKIIAFDSEEIAKADTEEITDILSVETHKKQKPISVFDELDL